MNEEDVNEQELGRFEDRFFGHLADTDRAAFDADLERDVELKGRYEMFVLTVRGIRSGQVVASDAEVSMRARFKAIDAELDAVPVRRLFQPWMGWAATLLLLIGIAGSWWLIGRDTPQSLANEFSLSEPGLPVLMSTSPQAIDAIMNAYKQDDMAAARALLTSAMVRDPANDTLRYFRGVVALRSEGCAVAEPHFAQVHSLSEFSPRARYAVALCTLQAGDVGAARELLSSLLSVTDAQVVARSRELLTRLDRL